MPRSRSNSVSFTRPPWKLRRDHQAIWSQALHSRPDAYRRRLQHGTQYNHLLTNKGASQDLPPCILASETNIYFFKVLK